MGRSSDEFVQNASFALSEGAMYERLRRHPSVEFDPYIFHASLIYDDKAIQLLEGIHREYIDVAQKISFADPHHDRYLARESRADRFLEFQRSQGKSR